VPGDTRGLRSARTAPCAPRIPAAQRTVEGELEGHPLFDDEQRVDEVHEPFVAEVDAEPLGLLVGDRSDVDDVLLGEVERGAFPVGEAFDARPRAQLAASLARHRVEGRGVAEQHRDPVATGGQQLLVRRCPRGCVRVVERGKRVRAGETFGEVHASIVELAVRYGRSVGEIEYDPFGAEVLADPFPSYATLREECPVHRYDGFDPPFVTITRHEDVSAMLRDWATWSSHYGQSPRFTVSGCLFSDPPAHTMYRRLVQQGFAPRVVERMHADITRLTDELIDVMIDRSGGDVESGGTGDLHDDIACPLPVLVIAHVLGVPTDQIAQFKEWSDRQVEAMGSQDPDAATENRAQIDAFFLDQLDRRRSDLAASGLAVEDWSDEALGVAVSDDVMSGLLVASVDGRRLTDDELLNILQQLLVGGNETTTSLITNLFWRILERPELAAELRDRPDLDAVAVEESLRFDAPVLGLYRTTTHDIELHGVTIPEKTKAMATFGAANRDPGAFEDPATFRLDRDLDQLRKTHLAFGLGRHFCPGAHLSRLEARIVLRRVLDRLPDLRLDGPTTRIPTFLLWGRRTFPIAWGRHDDRQ
jgi:cytochrome P450